jgi:hypothetical protein
MKLSLPEIAVLVTDGKALFLEQVLGVRVFLEEIFHEGRLFDWEPILAHRLPFFLQTIKFLGGQGHDRRKNCRA